MTAGADEDDLDARLARARERASEKAAADARHVRLRVQIVNRLAELSRLDDRLRAEESDVAALEGLGLAAMFSMLLGRREEQLSEERAEAMRAAVARDACRDAVEALRADEKELLERLDVLRNADAELALALAAREAVLQARGGPVAARLAEIDRVSADARAVVRELDEAVSAGAAAGSALREVAASLGSARNWGTFDMLGGGGFATWVKHSRLDTARTASSAAQRALDRFAREVADVRGFAYAELVVEIDGVSRFCDLFFDNLFTDWAVQNKIVASQANVASVQGKVSRVCEKLETRRCEVKRELDLLADERRRVVERG